MEKERLPPGTVYEVVVVVYKHQRIQGLPKVGCADASDEASRAIFSGCSWQQLTHVPSLTRVRARDLTALAATMISRAVVVATSRVAVQK